MTTTEPVIWPYGKHKGKMIEDLPTSYIEWALDQNFPETLAIELENQLALRAGEGVVRKVLKKFYVIDKSLDPVEIHGPFQGENQAANFILANNLKNSEVIESER